MTEDFLRLLVELSVAASRIEPSLHRQSGRDHVVHVGQRSGLRDRWRRRRRTVCSGSISATATRPTDFDHKFNFEESVNWVLPFGPHQRWLNSGAVASILGGWQLSGVVSAYSGLPFNVTASGPVPSTPPAKRRWPTSAAATPAAQGHWSRTQLVQPDCLLTADGLHRRRGDRVPPGVWDQHRQRQPERLSRTGIHSEQRFVVQGLSCCTRIGYLTSAAMRSNSPIHRNSTARRTLSPAEPSGKSPARWGAVPADQRYWRRPRAATLGHVALLRHACIRGLIAGRGAKLLEQLLNHGPVIAFRDGRPFHAAYHFR